MLLSCVFLIALCRNIKIDFHDVRNSRTFFADFEIDAIDIKSSFKGDLIT